MKTLILHKIFTVAMGNCLLAVTNELISQLWQELFLVFN